MNAHPKKERTFVILKPDAIQRSLMGDIVGRFEKVGLKVVAMRFGIPEAKVAPKLLTMTRTSRTMADSFARKKGLTWGHLALQAPDSR